MHWGRMGLVLGEDDARNGPGLASDTSDVPQHLPRWAMVLAALPFVAIGGLVVVLSAVVPLLLLVANEEVGWGRYPSPDGSWTAVLPYSSLGVCDDGSVRVELVDNTGAVDATDITTIDVDWQYFLGQNRSRAEWRSCSVVKVLGHPLRVPGGEQ